MPRAEASEPRAASFPDCCSPMDTGEKCRRTPNGVLGWSNRMRNGRKFGGNIHAIRWIRWRFEGPAARILFVDLDDQVPEDADELVARQAVEVMPRLHCLGKRGIVPPGQEVEVQAVEVLMEKVQHSSESAGMRWQPVPVPTIGVVDVHHPNGKPRDPMDTREGPVLQKNSLEGRTPLFRRRYDGIRVDVVVEKVHQSVRIGRLRWLAGAICGRWRPGRGV